MLSAILSLGEKVIDKLFPDPVKKAEAMLKLQELEQAGELKAIEMQMEVNKLEAANANLFISGWRPFVGWVCGLGLASAFVFPIFGVAAPSLEVLLPILLGMLGLGGLRTYEKLNKVASK